MTRSLHIKKCALHVDDAGQSESSVMGASLPAQIAQRLVSPVSMSTVAIMTVPFLASKLTSTWLLLVDILLTIPVMLRDAALASSG